MRARGGGAAAAQACGHQLRSLAAIFSHSPVTHVLRQC